MKGKFTLTATIERDPETGLFIGSIPSLPGAHTQAASLDELHQNLEEVAMLCLEEPAESGFVLIRQKGSHAFYKHPDGRYTTLPHHPGRDLGRHPKSSLVF